MFRLVASVFESRQHAAKTWRCTEENPSIRRPDLDIPSGEEHLANYGSELKTKLKMPHTSIGQTGISLTHAMMMCKRGYK